MDSTTNQVVLVQQNGTGIGLKASSPGNVGVLGTVSSTAKAGIVAGVEGTSSVNNGYGMFGYSTRQQAASVSKVAPTARMELDCVALRSAPAAWQSVRFPT